MFDRAFEVCLQSHSRLYISAVRLSTVWLRVSIGLWENAYSAIARPDKLQFMRASLCQTSCPTMI